MRVLTFHPCVFIVFVRGLCLCCLFLFFVFALDAYSMNLSIVELNSFSICKFIFTSKFLRFFSNLHMKRKPIPLPCIYYIC
jgi:hypothetical protein